MSDEMPKEIYGYIDVGGGKRFAAKVGEWGKARGLASYTSADLHQEQTRVMDMMAQALENQLKIQGGRVYGRDHIRKALQEYNKIKEGE